MFDINATAGSLLGSGNAQTIFAVNANSGASSEQQTAQAIVQANQREINRIRGYKLQLTPAESQRLNDIQSEILKIQEKTQDGTVRPDELEDRTELYKEADRIIGKPVLDYDVEDDEVLTDYVSALEALMQPKLDPATQKRVDALERVKENLETKLEERPDSASLLSQFQSVSSILNELKPLRLVEQLSIAERALYDTTVELINEHTGVQLQLNSRDAMRVTELERNIEKMSALL